MEELLLVNEEEAVNESVLVDPGHCISLNPVISPILADIKLSQQNELRQKSKDYLFSDHFCSKFL